MDMQLLAVLAASLAATGSLYVPAAAMQAALAGYSQVQTAAQQAVVAPPQPVLKELAFPQLTPNPLSLQTIVNKKFQLPANFVPFDLTPVNVAKKADEPLRAEAAAALERLFAAAQAAGIPLRLHSGYRSFQQQQALYDEYVQAEGFTAAELTSARAGYSEHQTGLAADFGALSSAQTSAAHAWVAAHGYEYGFVVRYEAGKDAVTGYSHEPWHIRYVGKELAATLHGKGLTLEEFYTVPGGLYGS